MAGEDVLMIALLDYPAKIMTKYGQGTRKDGTSWGWPMAKSLHPMRGNVGILGAYFNDDGVNLMHDNFFASMADETKAILNIARTEVPDICVSLHSQTHPPIILPTSYVPWFMKERIYDLAELVNKRFKSSGLPYTDFIPKPSVEDKNSPLKTPFSLVSAINQVSGAMAFVFECPHGTVSQTDVNPIISYAGILDLQLNLYEEMLDYTMENGIKHFQQ